MKILFKYSSAIVVFSLLFFSACFDSEVDNDGIAVSGVSLNKADTTITVGNTEELIASITPVNASNQSVQWWSSNEDVAQVSSSGLVTASAGGTATISVTTASGLYIAACIVTVFVPLNSVSLNKSSATVSIGFTETLIATTTPGDSTNQNFIWTSTTEGIAKVSSGGVVTGVSAGSTTIKVTMADSELEAICTVTVPVPGSLDISFSTDGVLTTAVSSSDDTASSVVIQSDGKIIVGGSTYNSTPYGWALLRYNSDGSLDTTFSGDGIAAIGQSHDRINDIVLQSDGRIIAAGRIHNGTNYDIAVARFKSDGSLDASFGGDGIVTTPIGSGNDYAGGVAIQSDGKIVVAGYADTGGTDDIVLVRYNSNGSLDTSFGSDGIVTTYVGISQDAAYDLAIQSDGRVVVAGVSHNTVNYDIAVLRYNNDGSLDTTFSVDGMFTYNVGAGTNHDYANAVTLQPDGKILIAGYTGDGGLYDSLLLRFNSNGSRDTDFGNDGIVINSFSAGFDIISDIAVQSDGKILTSGSSNNGTNSNIAVVRYNIDGSFDAAFDGASSGNGIVTTAIGLNSSGASAIAIQADNRIVLAGSSYNGTNSDIAIARYHP